MGPGRLKGGFKTFSTLAPTDMMGLEAQKIQEQIRASVECIPPSATILFFEGQF